MSHRWNFTYMHLFFSCIWAIWIFQSADAGTVVLGDPSTDPAVNQLRIQNALDCVSCNSVLLTGIFRVSSALHVRQPNFVFEGNSSQTSGLIQISPNSDLIGISSHNVTIRNLFLDCQTFSASTAISFGGFNNVSIEGCLIWASPNIFGIFAAGPSVPDGPQKLAAFESGNLDLYNRVVGNEIYSSWDGDVLSFSCQRFGEVSGNVMHGGRIVIYMSRDVSCVNNTVHSSVSHGFFLSTPAKNIRISHNQVFGSKFSSLIVLPNLESPISVFDYSENVTISNNVFQGSMYMGIEINQLENSLIFENQIKNISQNAIFLLRCKNMNISKNVFENFGTSFEATFSALWIDYNVSHLFIFENLFFSNPNLTHAVCGVKSQEPINDFISIFGNSFFGRLHYPFYAIVVRGGQIFYVQLEGISFPPTTFQALTFRYFVESSLLTRSSTLLYNLSDANSAPITYSSGQNITDAGEYRILSERTDSFSNFLSQDILFSVVDARTVPTQMPALNHPVESGDNAILGLLALLIIPMAAVGLGVYRCHARRKRAQQTVPFEVATVK